MVCDKCMFQEDKGGHLLRYNRNKPQYTEKGSSQPQGTCSQRSAGYEPSEGECDEEGPEPVQERNKFCKLFRKIGLEAGVYYTRFCPRDWNLLAGHTQQTYISGYRKLVYKLCETVSPNGPRDIYDQLIKAHRSQFWLQGEYSKNFGKYIQQAQEEYNNCIHPGCRLVALSLVTPFLSQTAASQHFPGLTGYYYKTSRKHALLHGLGKPKPVIQQLRRSRFDEEKLTSLISFIASPIISTQLPGKTATVKMASGEKKIIPYLMRLIPNHRIAKQYNELMLNEYNERVTLWQNNNQEGDEPKNLQMPEPTIMQILQCIPARKLKVIHGLDYYTHSGLEGIDNLLESVETIREAGKISDDYAKDLQQQISELRQYLTVGYKLHVKMESRVADHCIKFGLSDPKESQLQASCTSHDHTKMSEL